MHNIIIHICCMIFKHTSTSIEALSSAVSVFVLEAMSVLSLALLQHTGTAGWTQSVCMVCECVCVKLKVCMRVTKKVRERQREVMSASGVCFCMIVWVCVRVWSRCWDLCVSLGRECRGPWTHLYILLTRNTHLHIPTLTHTCTPHRSGRGWGPLCALLAIR